MKRIILAAALAALALPIAAPAQVPPAQNPANAPNIKAAGGQTVVITAGQIAQRTAALREKFAASKRPNTNEGILFAGGYKLTLEMRNGKQGALSHDSAEVLVILSGGGTITTGGTLLDPGPSINDHRPGSGIANGVTRRIGVGDMIMIPEETPHTFTPDEGGMSFITTNIPRTGRFAPVAGAPVKLFHAAADLPAMEEKAKPGVGVAPRLFGTGTFLSLPPYSVNLEYRGNQGNAAIHPDEAELMVVIDGSGSIETGGTLVTAAGGTSIQGGTVTPLNKGDIIFVPGGVAHLPRSTSHIVLATVHLPAN